MQIMNKKGLSNLIATVFIILLSIAAITTLSTQIFSLVNNPSLSPENSCVFLSTKNIIDITKVCYNTETKETEITLTRNNKNAILDSLKFSLDGETYSCDNSCGTCQIPEIGTQKYYFETKETKRLSFFINECYIREKTIENC